EYLRAETPCVILPDLWPPNSPDLNPIDYKIWGFIQERLYRSVIIDTDDLKKRLVEVWSTMSQSVDDNAIDDWRDRLTACVQARKTDLLPVCKPDDVIFNILCNFL